jgi:hypothetical protein
MPLQKQRRARVTSLGKLRSLIRVEMPKHPVMRILIVEDEARLAGTVARGLREANFNVSGDRAGRGIRAPQGRLCMKVLSSSLHPDLIVAPP